MVWVCRTYVEGCKEDVEDEEPNDRAGDVTLADASPRCEIGEVPPAGVGDIVE